MCEGRSLSAVQQHMDAALSCLIHTTCSLFLHIISWAKKDITRAKSGKDSDALTLQNFTWISSKFIVYTGFYLQELNSWKGRNRKKQTLDTTEVLAKSIYRYVILLVNINDKQLEMQCPLLKKHLFLYITTWGRRTVSRFMQEQKSHHTVVLATYAMVVHRHCVSCFRTALRGERCHFSQYLFFFPIYNRMFRNYSIVYLSVNRICVVNASPTLA